MNIRIIIPAVLAVVAVMAFVFAILPVGQAATVHTGILAALGKLCVAHGVNSTPTLC